MTDKPIPLNDLLANWSDHYSINPAARDALLSLLATRLAQQTEWGAWVGADTLKRWRTMIDFAPSEVQAEITVALAKPRTDREDARDSFTGVHVTTEWLAGVNAALHAIAAIPMASTEEQTNGHEDAYRAVEKIAQQPARGGDVGTVTRCDIGSEVREHAIALNPDFEESLYAYPAGTVVKLYAHPAADVAYARVQEAAAALAQARSEQSASWLPEVIERLQLVERTLRATDEHYELGKACGRMADGLKQKLRTEQPAAEGQGEVVATVTLSEASIGEEYPDAPLQLTEAGRRLPAGEHPLYAATPPRADAAQLARAFCDAASAEDRHPGTAFGIRKIEKWMRAALAAAINQEK